MEEPWKSSGRTLKEDACPDPVVMTTTLSLTGSPVLACSFHRRSTHNVSTRVPQGSVPLEVYPYHMTLEIWVEARNILGTAESERLQEDAGWFGERGLPADGVLAPSSV